MHGSLDVTCDFPGANPATPGRVRRAAATAFVVEPEIEDADNPAYKFRLDVDVRNDGDATQELELTVEWHEPGYMHLRDQLYWRAEDAASWMSATATRVDATRAHFRIPAVPGRTEISAQPRYGEREASALAGMAASYPGAEIVSLGRGQLGASIQAVRRPASETAQRPRLLLVAARIHPYESAGSVAVDGAVRALLGGVPLVAPDVELVLVPILNPDGVDRGACRTTGSPEGGVDLGRTWDPTHPICAAVEAFVRGRAVAGYIEIHSWMHRGVMGIKYLGRRSARRFIREVEAAHPTGEWRALMRRRVLRARPAGIMQWLRDHHRCPVAVAEIGWHGRSWSEVQGLGCATVRAFASICHAGSTAVGAADQPES